MTTFVLPADMEKRLDALVAKAHLPKRAYALKLFERALEDEEDYLIALERSDRRERGLDKARPFEELIEEYKREHGTEKLDH